MNIFQDRKKINKIMIIVLLVVVVSMIVSLVGSSFIGSTPVPTGN